MALNSASERQRRIAQFAKALKPMHHRAVKKVKGCCYAIIEERDSTAEFFASLKANKLTSLELSPSLRCFRFAEVASIDTTWSQVGPMI